MKIKKSKRPCNLARTGPIKGNILKLLPKEFKFPQDDDEGPSGESVDPNCKIRLASIETRQLALGLNRTPRCACIPAGRLGAVHIWVRLGTGVS